MSIALDGREDHIAEDASQTALDTGFPGKTESEQGAPAPTSSTTQKSIGLEKKQKDTAGGATKAGDEALKTPKGAEKKQSCGCKKDGRNLIVCIDGTSNQFGEKNSNVVEFYSLLKKEEADQRTWYNSGIGTYAKPSWKSLSYLRRTVWHKIDMAIAWNFEHIVCGAYHWLSDNYESGDCIFLFGFSRGAYQVRVISAMIHKVGLLHKGNEMQIPFAFELYSREEEDSKLCGNFKKTFSRQNVKVHFVGAWDTVSSVGVIRARKLLPNTTNGMEHVCYFRHALALDERRVKFLPEYANGGSMTRKPLSPVPRARRERLHTLAGLFKKFKEPESAQEPHSQPPRASYSTVTETTADVKEVWFAGTHSDIGGGNVENTDMSRQVPPLRWMVSEAKKAGLRMHEICNELQSLTTVDVVESLTWPWWLLEVLPLKHLAYTNPSSITQRPHWGRGRTISDGQKLHLSVSLTMESWVPKARPLDTWTKPTDPSTTLRHRIVQLLSGPREKYPEFLEFNTYERARIMLLMRFNNSKGPDNDKYNDEVQVQMHSDSQSDPHWREELLDALIDLLSEPASQDLGREILGAFITELSSFPIQRRSRALVDASRLIKKLEAGSDEKDKETARKFKLRFTVAAVIIQVDEWATSTVLSKDGKYIFHGTWNSPYLQVSDARTGKEVARMPAMGDISAIALSSNGGRCVVGGSTPGSGGFVQVFNWNEEQQQLSEAENLSFRDTANSVGFLPNQDPDQAEDIVALEDGEIQVWNASKDPVKLEGHTNQVDHIAFSHQCDTMTAYSWEAREFRVWKTATRKPMHTLPMSVDDSWALCIACSTNGALLAVGSRDGLIRIWDTKSRMESGKLEAHSGYVRSVGFSPDSKLLVSGSDDGTVKVWDVATCKLRETFVGHDDWVRSVAFAPDGKRIVSGGDDKTVRVWDIEDIIPSIVEAPAPGLGSLENVW
ncbi:hypothetical protein CPB85DRAFT_1446702 [Mucidula mucida]|nr:hypothetical protein CPB85DRAFT_1446702 [Mucidula mucida]